MQKTIPTSQKLPGKTTSKNAKHCSLPLRSGLAPENEPPGRMFIDMALDTFTNVGI